MYAKKVNSLEPMVAIFPNGAPTVAILPNVCTVFEPLWHCHHFSSFHFFMNKQISVNDAFILNLVKFKGEPNDRIDHFIKVNNC